MPLSVCDVIVLDAVTLPDSSGVHKSAATSSLTLPHAQNRYRARRTKCANLATLVQSVPQLFTS